MNAQLALFQEDIDFEELKPVPKVVVHGRKTDRKNELLGRCVRCGGHIESELGYCRECLNSTYCACHVCRQIASLHRMAQNDLYWLRRSIYSENSHIRATAETAEKLRNHPKCSEVSK